VGFIKTMEINEMKGKTVTFIVNFPGGPLAIQGKVKEVQEFITIETSSDDEPYRVSPDQILGVHQ
jgi:hypothetical protein